MFPFIERIFADGGYAGQKMALVAWRTGAWRLQIVKRSDAAGLSFAPLARSIEFWGGITYVLFLTLWKGGISFNLFGFQRDSIMVIGNVDNHQSRLGNRCCQNQRTDECSEDSKAHLVSP